MTTETTTPELIEEVETLLAKIPAWKLTAAEWGNEMRVGYFEHGSRFTVAKVHSFAGPTVDKPLADLFAASPELLRRMVEEVKRQRGVSTDAVIQKIGIMQEKYPGARIEISVEPDSYCHVTRSDGSGNIQPIAEGATIGDVFED